MEAVQQTSYNWETNVMENPLLDSDWKSKRSYSRQEFMDKLAQRLGRYYGLEDIRDAR